MESGEFLSYMLHLKCRECGRIYPLEPIAACSECWAPLEVIYDYDRLRSELKRTQVASRSQSMRRYWELLPVKQEPWVGKHTGFTPLVRAPGLAKALGVRQLYIKNE